MSDSPVMTLEEAADMVRVSPDWLRKSDCPRSQPSPGVVRYLRDDVLAWLRAHSTVKMDRAA